MMMKNVKSLHLCADKTFNSLLFPLAMFVER